jgi:hypothetical protein
MVFLLLGSGLISAALAHRWRALRSFRTERRVAEAYVALVFLLALINWSQW